jgi:hypothetical protein
VTVALSLIADQHLEHSNNANREHQFEGSESCVDCLQRERADGCRCECTIRHFATAMTASSPTAGTTAGIARSSDRRVVAVQYVPAAAESVTARRAAELLLTVPSERRVHARSGWPRILDLPGESLGQTFSAPFDLSRGRIKTYTEHPPGGKSAKRHWPGGEEAASPWGSAGSRPASTRDRFCDLSGILRAPAGSARRAQFRDRWGWLVGSAKVAELVDALDLGSSG